jgi:ABC-type anion transport system duplicated permease subunit
MRKTSQRHRLTRIVKVISRVLALAATLTLAFVLLELHDRLRVDRGITEDVITLMGRERVVTIVAIGFLILASLMDVWVIRQEMEMEDGELTTEEAFLGYGTRSTSGR